ncbi:DUF3261 domain-containing protein [Aliikangiella sp. G2MR2-5]|uniref:DUF3261 domain-containing protein n=1 Tax=Aliikangiella sp. G2MR2-5 TaxID=2788943 RepID=UPI0018AC355E|nr:DUF3261 domain-containing protein [Aliikangiella sp. G2MR2-5]
MSKLFTYFIPRMTLICCSLLFLSCASQLSTQRRVEIAKGINFPLLAPHSFGDSVALTQLAKVNYEKDSGEQLLFRIEISPEKMTVAGLTLSGTRLFAIEYDGSKIISEGLAAILDKIKPQYLLADIQISLWPSKVLLKHFDEQICVSKENCLFSVDSKSGARELYQNNKHLFTVNYLADTRDAQKIEPMEKMEVSKKLEVIHYQRKYRLMIKNLEKESIESSNE